MLNCYACTLCLLYLLYFIYDGAFQNERTPTLKAFAEHPAASAFQTVTVCQAIASCVPVRNHELRLTALPRVYGRAIQFPGGVVCGSGRGQ